MRSMLKIAKTGYLVLSALLLLAGVGLTFFSDTCYPILTALLGVLFLAFGIVKLVGFFSKDPYQLVFETDLVFGILYLALGLLLLLRPAHTMAFFGIVFGLMLMADGLTRVRIALDARPFGIRAWWLILVSAIATAILGVVLLFHPSEGTQVLTQLLGISLMVDGVMNISTILAAVRVIRAARPGDDGEDYELVDD